MGLSGALVLVALGAMGIAALVLTEWVPPTDETYQVSGGTAGPLGSPVKLLTWNVGYAAMDRDTDFFMDGGKLSRGRSIDAVESGGLGIENLHRHRVVVEKQAKRG